ncbi:type II toxin-antitoxin system prevent-host-death family antitoxin [uncultured Thermomonospora sp.]|uniref:type II toxin-antitoxin system prevent-host-death family antitoxin n=1 Tax=uncultured Thermomonospora sp. TaxID=671175 RepID=UPI00259B6D7B|nr:type II toxin-antitoxin system prevent-host-death family antitoxin [uncultured Thermomonospora sp.]
MVQAAQELSTRDVRANLAQVINDAAARGVVTFITSRGRRIAAVVPVHVAEAVVEGKSL